MFFCRGSKTRGTTVEYQRSACAGLNQPSAIDAAPRNWQGNMVPRLGGFAGGASVIRQSSAQHLYFASAIPALHCFYPSSSDFTAIYVITATVPNTAAVVTAFSTWTDLLVPYLHHNAKCSQLLNRRL